jgi:hypothetical protein
MPVSSYCIIVLGDLRTIDKGSSPERAVPPPVSPAVWETLAALCLGSALSDIIFFFLFPLFIGRANVPPTGWYDISPILFLEELTFAGVMILAFIYCWLRSKMTVRRARK